MQPKKFFFFKNQTRAVFDVESNGPSRITVSCFVEKLQVGKC